MNLNVKGCIVQVDPDVYEDYFPVQHDMIILKGYVYLKVGNKRHALHRLIMGEPKGKLVDHKNGNILDNRRENLRVATRSQNAINRDVAGDKTSVYRGVFRTTQKVGKYQYTYYWAKVKLNGEVMFYKAFKTELEAAYAYDAAARIYHGEFARLNFPNF